MKHFFIISIVHLLIICSANAQNPGCTDILAKNFNAAAQTNDGSCLYNNTTLSVSKSLVLSDTLVETSGLIYFGGELYTHNDNLDKNIYVIDSTSGSIKKAINIYNSKNIDWEDLAEDSLYIYVGDFGNNADGNRKNLNILKINKASLSSTIQLDTIHFSYPEQVNFSSFGNNNTDFDCEALIVYGDSLYLFTKQWKSKNTHIYKLPKTKGVYKAALIDSINVNGLITGATTSEKNGIVILSGYSSLLSPFIFLLYDFKNLNFSLGNKRKIKLKLPFHQIEGITFIDSLHCFLSNEKFSSSKQKLHTINLSPFLSSYYNPTVGVSINEDKPNQELNLFPNPAKDVLTISSSAVIGKYKILSNNGKIVLKGKSNKNKISIDISTLKYGSYTF